MQYLKLPTFSAIALLLASCSKTPAPEREYTCGYPYDYQIVTAVFKGFTATDLQAVEIKAYAADGTFSNLISTVTEDFSDAMFSNDTAYIKESYYYRGLIDLKPGSDYEISVKASGQVYRISDIHAGSTFYSWTQGSPCSMGASQARIVPYLLKINGQDIYPYAISTNNYLVCLPH